MPRCFLALGGNVGDVKDAFRQATDAIRALPTTDVLRVSDVYRTVPVGAHAGRTFLNAAAAVETALGPFRLLDELQAIESDFGRRREIRWGPRPLDLDLVFYENQIIDTPRLRVPHPACWYRRFVLDPLAEIAPDVAHPEKGVTVKELHNRLLTRPLEVALAAGDEAARRRLIELLQGEFPNAALRQWTPGMQETAPEPALLFWLGASGSGTGETAFQALPRIPRLDVSATPDVATFIRDVLHAALNE